MTELCALNPELLDHINNVLGNAAPPPRPAPDKVSVGLLPSMISGERMGLLAATLVYTALRLGLHYWTTNGLPLSSLYLLLFTALVIVQQGKINLYINYMRNTA